MTKNITVIDAIESDIEEVARIYQHYVNDTTVTLEEVAPTVDEMKERWQAVTSKNLLFLVAKDGDQVVGFSYVVPYRQRSAYRFVVESSVYVDHKRPNQGVGTALMQEILSRCKELGYKQILAVIGDSQNVASVRFHEKLGFEKSGTLKNFGYKFDKWVDNLLMQKAL